MIPTQSFFRTSSPTELRALKRPALPCDEASICQGVYSGDSKKPTRGEGRTTELERRRPEEREALRERRREDGLWVMVCAAAAAG